MIIGYYLQGYSVAKEVISVLNRLGLTVAYNTICESWVQWLSATKREIENGFRRGRHLDMLLTIV